jgi:hypothetical protein
MGFQVSRKNPCCELFIKEKASTVNKNSRRIGQAKVPTINVDVIALHFIQLPAARQSVKRMNIAPSARQNLKKPNRQHALLSLRISFNNITYQTISLSSADISSKNQIEMIKLKTLELEESGNCKYEIYLQPLIPLRFAPIVL